MASVQEMDFATYDVAELQRLGQGIVPMADGVLGSLANRAGFDLPSMPTDEDMSSFIGYVAPNKELQANIGSLQERFTAYYLEEVGSEDAARARGTEAAADLVERSGVLLPISRAFRDMSPVPDKISTVYATGGVANWMLRRRTLLERLDPKKVGRIVMPLGQRTMGEGEHQLVSTYARTHGRAPTEAEFGQMFFRDVLHRAGFLEVHILPVESLRADVINDALLAEMPSIKDGTILTVNNAPAAVMTTAQLREAIHRVDAKKEFDSGDNQLFMMSDTIPVARRGEGTATHQNPFSGLGQLVRIALHLRRAVEASKTPEN